MKDPETYIGLALSMVAIACFAIGAVGLTITAIVVLARAVGVQ